MHTMSSSRLGEALMTQKIAPHKKNAEMHDGQNTTNSKSADAKPLIKGCLKQSNAAARWGSLQRGGQLHNARGANCICTDL